MKIKIKDTKILFNEWKFLSQKINDLSSIIQNELEIDSKNVVEWINMVNYNIDELKILKNKILTHIKKVNNL